MNSRLFNAELVSKTQTFVSEYMAQYRDSSHDYAHIQRVERTALDIYDDTIINGFYLDRILLQLAALLHDVGDHKYVTSESDPTPAATFLLSIGASKELATNVQDIVSHVSYSHEKKNPAAVAEVLKRLPELGAVQDADRLDAIGAVGIGRCFTYSACRSQREGSSTSSMDDSVQHFDDKLVTLERMMKTEKGKELAKVRTDRIKLFQSWWKEEQI